MEIKAIWKKQKNREQLKETSPTQRKTEKQSDTEKNRGTEIKTITKREKLRNKEIEFRRENNSYRITEKDSDRERIEVTNNWRGDK